MNFCGPVYNFFSVRLRDFVMAYEFFCTNHKRIYHRPILGVILLQSQTHSHKPTLATHMVPTHILEPQTHSHAQTHNTRGPRVRVVSVYVFVFTRVYPIIIVPLTRVLWVFLKKKKF